MTRAVRERRLVNVANQVSRVPFEHVAAVLGRPYYNSEPRS
jgi:hypothetical protein